MKGQELKLLFRDNMAFLTQEVVLDFNQVQIASYPVRFQAPAFWTIRVIAYIENEKRLHVEVLSYQVGETRFPVNQIDLADLLMSVEKVTFKSIDTSGLLSTLNSKQPVKILPAKPETVYRQETPMLPETKLVREPVKQTYDEPFSIPIKDVKFVLGGVSFEKKIQAFKKTIGFRIANESIIEEYDAIKNYFASVLKTKRIQVIPEIITIDGVITSVTATSAEIEKIDKTLIEEAKFEWIKGKGKKESAGDEQLFTFETFADENLSAQVVFNDENEFIENLLTQSGTKHYNHLRFLSSRHQSGIQKLRFGHQPFSFVFLLKGNRNFHIVWETLDTAEATYIWTVGGDERDLKTALAEADKTISRIIRDGKNEYISRHEENFARIFHDYSDLQNGFKNWKEEIEKIVK